MAKAYKTMIPPSLAAGFRRVIAPDGKTKNAAGTVRRSPLARYASRADHRALIIRRAEIAADWLVSHHANNLRGAARRAWWNERKAELIAGIFPPEWWEEIAPYQDQILPPRASAGWRDEEDGAEMVPVWFSIIARSYDMTARPQASEGAPLWFSAAITLNLTAEKHGHWVWLQPSCYTHFSESDYQFQTWRDVFNGGFYGSKLGERNLSPPAVPWAQLWNYYLWGDTRVGKTPGEQKIINKVRLNVLSQNTAKKYGAGQAWAQCETTADTKMLIARMT